MINSVADLTRFLHRFAIQEQIPNDKKAAEKSIRNELILALVCSLVLLISGSGFITLLFHFFICYAGLYLSRAFRVLGHELSHALVAFLVGFPLFSITIGWPGISWERRFLGINWKFDPGYFGGEVSHGVYAPSVRLKYWLIVVAGPIWNILYLGFSFLMLFLYVLIFPPVTLKGFYPLTAFLVGCCLEGSSGAIQTFRHEPFNRQGRLLDRDIRLLWKIPYYTEYEVESMLFWTREQLIQQGRASQLSDPEIKEMLGSDLKTRVLMSHLTQHIPSNHDSQLKLWKRVMILGTTKQLRSRTIYHYLTYLVCCESVAQEPQADGLSLELIELTNNSEIARRIRGSVLVELDRVDEGRKILTQVLEESFSPITQFYSNAFLAIAEEKSGNHQLFETYREAALSLPSQRARAGPLWDRISLSTG